MDSRRHIRDTFFISPAVFSAAAMTAMAPVHIKTRDYTVLLVDGDSALRGEVAKLLRRVGFRIRDFERGEELLEVPRHALDGSCVISEMALPGMSGLELARSLRDRAISIPFIILTAHADVAMAVHAMRNEVADFLLKPVMERELVRRVTGALERHAEKAGRG
jgi:two-component system response regulator FixJ